MAAGWPPVGAGSGVGLSDTVGAGAIVMHSAPYAAPDMLGKWGKLGRSDGCFALASTTIKREVA